MMTFAPQKLTLIRDHVMFECMIRRIARSAPRRRIKSMAIRRLRLFSTIAFVVILTLFSLSCSEPKVRERPNVLLVTLDTLRPDFLGAYGSSAGASPRIDEFARKSVVFERAIAASPRTVPSHASIMTSLWVREHSVGWVNGSSRINGEECR